LLCWYFYGSHGIINVLLIFRGANENASLVTHTILFIRLFHSFGGVGSELKIRPID
jgi:hypothetical protein